MNSPIEISRLEDYLNHIGDFATSEKSHLYRGQEDAEWDVTSGVLRRLLSVYKGRTQLLPSLCWGYLLQLVDEVQLEYPSIYRSLSPLECLAHLQHNGVATGLIDFTFNPLVALWFACAVAEKQASGKVIVLENDSDKICAIKSIKELESGLENFFGPAGSKWHLWAPALDSRLVDTQRITRQYSVFLRSAQRNDLQRNRHSSCPQSGAENRIGKCGNLGGNPLCRSARFLGEEHVTALLRHGSHQTLLWRNPMSEDRVINGVSLHSHYLIRGSFRLAADEYDPAIEDFNKSLELKPGQVHAHSYRGLAYLAKGEYDLAGEDFNTTRKLDPRYPYAYYNLGELYRAQGDVARAIEEYNTAITCQSDLAEAYNRLGEIYYAQGDVTRAIEEYSTAIKCRYNFVDACINRGTAYYEQGALMRAIKDFSRAIKFRPRFAEAYYYRGNAYRDKGYYEFAIENYSDAISLKSDYAEAKAALSAEFHKHYESLAAFEEETGESLPQDIAALVTQPQS